MEVYIPFSNFHEVIDNLYIGNKEDACNKDLLKSKVMLSLQLENLFYSYSCC